MDDVFIYIFPLPSGIDEMVVPCAEGYTVYISDRLDQTHRLKAYEHAVAHIRRDDWQQFSVQTIEAEVRYEKYKE